MTPAADTGLANERTALAWQRTALSLVVGAAILGRLTFDDLGWWAVAILGVAAVISAWVFVESRWRYVQHRGTRHRGRGRGGRASLALCVATCLIGITEAAALLV